MSKVIYRSFTDYCPFLQDDNTIEMTFAEINSIGSSQSGYKLTGYSCPHSDDCPYPERSRLGLCPVAEKAQNELI